MKSNEARMSSTCLKNRCADKMGEHGCDITSRGIFRPKTPVEGACGMTGCLYYYANRLVT